MIERLKQMAGEALVFVRTLVWPVASSMRENVGLAAFSVVLGVALWVFVTDADSTTRSGVLPFDLAVEEVNVPGDLAVARSLVNVRVRVEVAEDVWSALSASDFEATVDLDRFQAGTYDVSVNVEQLTGRGGLRVLEVIPDTVEVELKALFSKSVPLDVVMEGAPPLGYEAGVARADAETVLVTGTQDKVAAVDKVVATIDLTARTQDAKQAVRLEALDAQERPVDKVTLDPSVVNVSVEIAQTEFSRALAVTPELTGAPAEGYDVVDVQVDPAVITVFGPSSFIAEAATIRTQPIDISDSTEDVVKTVALDLPPEVSVSGGTSVTVTVQIEPAQGRRTLGLTVAVVGLGADVVVSGPLPSVEVSLLGELPTLQGLKPNDVSATLNLTDLGAGTYEVTVTVSAPADVIVASVSPETVQVTLEPR